MDVYNELTSHTSVIRTVDMHTCGEPTRIVVSGFPPLAGGTLLEKRQYARERLDHLRMRLMREPRGHGEMYGAIIVRETELTERGEADVGVLFMHNEGYSTMCGHATIALGRFLVDTQDTAVFPRRGQLRFDAEKGATSLRLHAPCGVVDVSVPTAASADGKADGGGRVQFVSVPSFVAALDVPVRVGGVDVLVDVAYGGAFYAVVSAEALGFGGGLRDAGLAEVGAAAARVKAQLAARRALVAHPSERELEFLYGVIVTDAHLGHGHAAACFFADGQLDRSPTGSGVSARVALAVARGAMAVGDSAVFDSPLSLADPAAAFVGTALAAERVVGSGGRAWAGVRVEVAGRASYTGAHAFVAEDADALGAGFVMT